MRREESYRWAIGQIRKKVRDNISTISTLANVSAILKERFENFFWVGFYFFKGDHLLLGPFQGPPACVRLSLDRGVCADCAKSGDVMVVDDVHKYPGHVACDPRSNSEIVLPVYDRDNNLKAVLDIDSTVLNDFSSVDRDNLLKITGILKDIWE